MNESYTGQEMGEKPEPKKNTKSANIEKSAVTIAGIILFLIAISALS